MCNVSLDLQCWFSCDFRIKEYQLIWYFYGQQKRMVSVFFWLLHRHLLCTSPLIQNKHASCRFMFYKNWSARWRDWLEIKNCFTCLSKLAFWPRKEKYSTPSVIQAIPFITWKFFSLFLKDLFSINAFIHVEKPQKDIHSFVGTLVRVNKYIWITYLI